MFFVDTDKRCCQKPRLVESRTGKAGNPLGRIRALLAVVLVLAIGFAPMAGHAAIGVLKGAPIFANAVTDADCPHAALSVTGKSEQALLIGKRGGHDRTLPTTLKCCSQGLCCAVTATGLPSFAVHRTIRLSSFFVKREPQVRSRAGTRLERPPKRA